MKKILKFLALVIAAAILVQALPFMVVDVAGVSNYEKEAKQQHTIDLYKGTDTGLDPDVILNRETGIVMLLRLVGKEDEAELMPEADVKTKLAEFKDSDTVSSWAKNR